MGTMSCCQDVSDSPVELNSDIVTIYASLEPETTVKNVIDDVSKKVTWLSGDAINVFFGASESSRFVTENSGEIAQFKGSINVVTGGGEGLNDDTSLWGIYPYDESNTCNGTQITLTLPSLQDPAENTFANGLFPQIARSWNFYMTFYNLCGCIKFSVENPDIKFVTLESNDNEAIAGKVLVSMDGSIPVVDEIISSETKLTMHAPDNGYFKPGVNYYFVLLPTEFSKGMTVTYYKDNSAASYVYSKSYTLLRNKVATFNNRDADLTFESRTLNSWEEGETIGGEI